MNQEFTPTSLYIKTHNTTGLKYFGKTTNIDPNKYKGSGKHWIRHLKKHGYDVTTEIVGVFTDEIWIQLYALEFSETNNIIESADWANLMSENGMGGGVTPEARSKGNKTQKENKLGFYDPEFRVKHNQYLKENKLGVYDPTVSAKGCVASQSDKARQNRSDSAKGRIMPSQLGKMWITDGSECTLIKKEVMIPEGWCKGRILESK